MTRSRSRQLAMDNYPACIVRIKRNLHLENLYANRRSAYIASRRQTISFDNARPSTSTSSSSSASANQNPLFMNISNRPFTRRNSVFAQLASVPTENANRNALNDSFEANDHDKDENVPPCNEQGLLLFLPPVNTPTCDKRMNGSSPILDMIVPNSSDLQVPLKPSFGYSTSLLDHAIPSNGIDLPMPLIPLSEHQANVICADRSLNTTPMTGPVRKRIPHLIPICDMNLSLHDKQYGKKQKVSKTSQLIVDTLNNFEKSHDSNILNTSFSFVSDTSTVAPNRISVSEELDSSDQFYGHLTYDGDSE